MMLFLAMFLICMRPGKFNTCHSTDVLLQCIFSTILLILRYTHSSLINSSSQFSRKLKFTVCAQQLLEQEYTRLSNGYSPPLKIPKKWNFIMNLCLGIVIFKGYLNSLRRIKHLELWRTFSASQWTARRTPSALNSHLKDPADQAYGLKPERLWFFTLLLLTKGYFLLRRMLIMPSDVLKGTVRNLMEINFLGCHWVKNSK